MALFDNVTYTYYSDTLGRSKVPDEAAFNEYALENKLYLQQLINDGLIIERAPNGYDSACCLMIEEDYSAAQAQADGGELINSESIGGFSYSLNTKAQDIALEKNTKSIAQKKYKWINLYCEVTNGVK